MKIRILSDLHLECFPFSIPSLPDDAQSVLVLAGDIAPIARRTLLAPFLIEAAKQFRAVCFVAGNHEFYAGTWPRAIGKMKTWGLPRNVHVLERDSVHIDDVIFLGATLWTDLDGGNPLTMMNAQQGMMDYHAIMLAGSDGGHDGPARLTPERTVEDHTRSRAWIEEELATAHRSSTKAVLITHHGISPQSVHSQYAGNPLNPAFVSDLTDVLRAYPPAVVVHGHTHSSFDYRLGGEDGPRVVVNPRGYTRSAHSQENEEFDPLLCVTI